MSQAFNQSMEREELKPSTGVLSETERLRIYGTLCRLSGELHALRGDPRFWLSLGPGFRVRYEDFQGDLAAVRAAWRK